RERELNAQLLRDAPPNSLIDTGCDNSLEDFLGLIELCDAVVTSDSLAMHLAIARKKQVIALMGSTSISEIDLYGRGEILSASFDCSPCYRKSCEKRPSCMDALDPNSVLQSILRSLQQPVRS